MDKKQMLSALNASEEGENPLLAALNMSEDYCEDWDDAKEVEVLTLMTTMKTQADYYKDWNKDMEAQLLYDRVAEIKRLRALLKREE
jgi:hypothetical protein